MLQALSTDQEMLFKSTHHGQSYMVPKYLCIRSKQIAEHLCLHMVRTKFLRTDPFESCHDKTKQFVCALSEDSNQHRHLSSLIRVFTVRSVGNKGPKFFHAESKDSDQNELMPRLI